MTQQNNAGPVSAPSVSPKKEKDYGQKTIKFYYQHPDPHVERALWYISHLHKTVWNNMLAICNGDFSLVDTLLDKINPKGQEEIAHMKAGATVETKKSGEEYVKIRTLSEFGMLYVLGPMRNADPELLQLPLNDLQKPCRVLAKSWKSFFELAKRGDAEARPPRMKSDTFFSTLQWEKPKVATRDGISFLIVQHKIPGLGELHIPLPSYVADTIADKKARYVTIKRKFPFYDRPSLFEVSLVYETSRVPKALVTQDTVFAGVDVGARRITLAVRGTNMVKTWHLPKVDQYFTKQRQILDARIKSKQKGSRAWVVLCDVRTSLSHRWANVQKDIQRKIAYQMVQYADVFFVGETNIRLGLAQSKDGSKGQHRAVQNTGNLARFTRFLVEKADEQGKLVVKVPDFVSGADKRIRKVESAVRHMEYGLAKSE